MSAVKGLVCAMAVMAVLCGCHPGGDDDGGWTRIETPEGYPYYVADCGGQSRTLYAAFPGYGGGYEDEISQAVRKYLVKTGRGGVVIRPRMEYKDASSSAHLAAAKALILQLTEDCVVLLGGSAGASTVLSIADEVGAKKVVVAGAGSYAKMGGKPSDELPTPSWADILIVDGYDQDFLAKTGYRFDGTVWTDPAVRLAERTGANLIMLPDVKHNDTMKVLCRTEQFLDWITR